MLLRRNMETSAGVISRTGNSRPLLAELAISQVGGEPVRSGVRKVLLIHMNANELEFSTTLRFPVNDRYRLSFQLKLGEKSIVLEGIVASRVKQGNLYLYELRIAGSSISRTDWIRELNEWLLRHQPALPEHKVHYLYRN